MMVGRRGLGSLAVARMAVGAASGIVDSHLHVWASTSPYARPPPPELGDASVEAFLEVMGANRVDQAVIVQPINYEFDHTYVTECIERYPSKFRGILLAKPGGAEEIKALSKKGFTGVRLNPYLWANRDGEWIADADGRAIVEASADLKMPVGVMAFGGLSPLIDHVRTLASMRPDGIVVLDHFGFPREDPAKPPGPELGFDEQAWAQLLGLGPAYPNIYVKVSALFRVSREPPPHRDLEPRFREVLGAFGADRLLWGSDFPYVQQQGEDGYAASLDAVASWCPPEAAEKILGLTARALYRLPSSS